MTLCNVVQQFVQDSVRACVFGSVFLASGCACYTPFDVHKIQNAPVKESLRVKGCYDFLAA